MAPKFGLKPPKWLPWSSQNGAQVVPKWSQGAPWLLPGSSQVAPKWLLPWISQLVAQGCQSHPLALPLLAQSGS